MKERPILFSAPMVRAILDGRKTQTRRVVKPRWIHVIEESNRVNGYPALSVLAGEIVCPHGEVGERLWVRETFRILGSGPGEKIPKSGNRDMVQYFADHDESYIDRYRPSIHMPRWASRITLEIVRVRVERLQEISEEGAITEGLEWVSPTWGIKGIAESWNLHPIDTYRALWHAINGYDSWASNPWVWVIEFKRINPC